MRSSPYSLSVSPLSIPSAMFLLMSNETFHDVFHELNKCPVSLTISVLCCATSREKGEITRLSGDNGMPSRHSSRYCIIHSGSFRHSFQSQGHAVMTLSNFFYICKLAMGSGAVLRIGSTIPDCDADPT